jgi:hypothetical protein
LPLNTAPITRAQNCVSSPNAVIQLRGALVI